MLMLLLAFIAGVHFYFNVWRRKEEKPIFNVYRQAGRWFPVKYWVFMGLLQLRKWRKKPEGDDGPKYSIDELKQLGPHPKAIDATYINSASHDGYYLVVGTARRPHGAINGFLTAKIPGLGLLETPKAPDTLMFQEDHDEPYFGAEGLRLTMIKPLQEWSIKYEGKMRLCRGSETKMVDVQLNSTWATSKPQCFDFETDIPASTIARNISREPWSRQYFQTLKESHLMHEAWSYSPIVEHTRAHQTHIEQFGRIRGKIVVDGKSYDLDLEAFRDRSNGKFRCWKNIHRYAFNIYHLEDGSHFQAALISHPITSSAMEAGFFMTPAGEIVPMERVDFPIWQHGEDGHAPKDYALSFTAGGERYDVQITVIEDDNFESELRFGWEWEARVIERYSKCKVNGINGWGVTEWAYPNYTGRPAANVAADPPRFASVNKG